MQIQVKKRKKYMYSHFDILTTIIFIDIKTSYMVSRPFHLSNENFRAFYIYFTLHFTISSIWNIITNKVLIITYRNDLTDAYMYKYTHIYTLFYIVIKYKKVASLYA